MFVKYKNLAFGFNNIIELYNDLLLDADSDERSKAVFLQECDEVMAVSYVLWCADIITYIQYRGLFNIVKEAKETLLDPDEKMVKEPLIFMPAKRRYLKNWSASSREFMEEYD